MNEIYQCLKSYNCLLTRGWLIQSCFKVFLTILQGFCNKQIPVPLHPHWKIREHISTKVDGMKCLQFIMIWYMTLFTLSYLCIMPRGLQHNCKVNGSVLIAGWVINWTMWTQHNPRFPPGVIAMISKGSYLQIFRIIINFVYRAFLFLNPSTIHVVLN